MRGVAVVIVVVVAGCGRFGFGTSDPSGDASGSAVDSAPRDGLGDTMGDGAAVACAPGLDLCDGFEEPTLDGAIWDTDPMVTLDTTRAHRGAQSIHVHSPAFAANTGSYTTLRETRTITIGGTFWVRAWFWLSALPAGQNGLELITAERPGSAGDYLFVRSDRTSVYSQFADNSQSSMTTLPTGTWVCTIWKVVRSTSATGSLTLSGDAPAITFSNAVTDSTAMPMTVVTMGLGFSGTNVPVAQPALDLWIDDVIADSSPVSCTD
jgi:hypothetical protein